MLERLLKELTKLVLQSAEIADAFSAFQGLRRGQGPGGVLSLNDSGPAVIGAVEFGRLVFTGAVGLTAGALGGGEAAREQGQSEWDGGFFMLHPDI